MRLFQSILPPAALIVFAALCIAAISTSKTLAQTAEGLPGLRVPAPAIVLADNLDEVDGLGWCIDTVGRGFNTALHAHSCKPQGGDVQFSFDPSSGAIRSVAFDSHCVTTGAGETTDLALAPCDAQDVAQRFVHVPDAGQFSPAETPELCFAVGADSRRAGPFMSRDLLLSDCGATPETHTRWVILN
ncbi:RICIN domain-containing protein [Pacificoceanicola onchidii]|uniref:RICIN domain-containing protein n=1 Tax=Pacificoceanicola onchidii TaxID=2562685 RepID=UPI0010A51497|nr:RICIN domain-containing protein [Pacificoceanicola onchidii]